MNKKLGRPKDEFRALQRAMFPEWSERTFARYYAALTAVRDDAMVYQRYYGNLDWYSETILEAMTSAERPNGSFNVSQFERACENIRVMKALELLEAGVLEERDGGLFLAESAIRHEGEP